MSCRAAHAEGEVRGSALSGGLMDEHSNKQTWQQALDRAWERVHEDGWRMRVHGWRDTSGQWFYCTVRAGRRKARA